MAGLIAAPVLAGCAVGDGRAALEFEALPQTDRGDWPRLLPLAAFDTGEDTDDAPQERAQTAEAQADALARRAAALRARARGLSGAVLTPEEKARLQAAGANG